jgi:hypothetical protein
MGEDFQELRVGGRCSGSKPFEGAAFHSARDDPKSRVCHEHDIARFAINTRLTGETQGK